MDKLIDYLDKKNEKTYEFKVESINIAKMQMKADKIGKVTSLCLYGLLAYMLLTGLLGQKFLVTYVTGKVSSGAVKFLMR